MAENENVQNVEVRTISPQAEQAMDNAFSGLQMDMQQTVMEAAMLNDNLSMTEENAKKVDAILAKFDPKTAAPFQVRPNATAEEHIKSKQDEQKYYDESRKAFNAQLDAEKAEMQLHAQRAVNASDKGKQMAVATEYTRGMTLLQRMKAMFFGLDALAHQAKAASDLAKAQSAAAINAAEILKQQKPADVREALEHLKTVNSITTKQQKLAFKGMETTKTKLLPNLNIGGLLGLDKNK